MLVAGPLAENITGGVASFARLHLGNRLLRRDFTLAGFDTGDWREASLPVRLLASAALYLRLMARVILTQPRIVHIHCSSGRSFYEKSVLAAACRLLGKKTVLHVHGGGFQEFYRSSPLKPLIRFLLGRPHAVAAVAPFWKERLEQLGRAVTLVVPNCADYDFFEVAEDPAGRRLLVFIGDLTEDKGVFVLLEAIRALRERGFSSPCVLAGRIQAGPGSRRFEEAVGDRRLGEVRVVRNAGGKEVRELLAQAAVFVLPSRSEGLPIAMLEAMAAGVPVVASRVGGIPDAVTDGVEGCLVAVDDAAALADKIAALLADDRLRQDMGSRARERALADFHPDRAGQALARLYDSILQKE
ncbi:MAG: glycosyltransferase family 4 protein [Candidatus Glassbacteria bacterium]